MITSQIPQIIEKQYKIIKKISSGGSVGKILIVKDKAGNNRILKYAEWEGIGYNGIPWTEMQAKRLVTLRKVVSQKAKKLLPVIYVTHKEKKLFYFVSEYYDKSVPLSIYYLSYEGEIIKPLLKDINNVLSNLSNYFYSLGKIKAPKNYLKRNYFGRIDYKLELLKQQKGEIYERYFKNKKFTIDEHTYTDISLFFEDLLKRNKVIINGKEFINATILLARIKKNSPELMPGFLPKYTHGDLLLRNVLKLPDGKTVFIDVRGVPLPNNYPSRVCIPYELGKILHSIEMEIIRTNNFKMAAFIKNKNLEFQLFYNLENKNIDAFLKIRQKLPSIFSRNKDLQLNLKEEKKWLEQAYLLEALHFLSDVVNRLEQDKTGYHSIAYYLIGTRLLNTFYRRNRHLFS